MLNLGETFAWEFKAQTPLVVTMNSIDIAGLVGSRHDKVKQSIDRLADRGVIALPPLGEKATAGRFNLNALHKASGTAKKKGPSYWLALDGTKQLISELERQTTEISVVTMEGRNGGTFVHELLAIEYAGWISPRFCTSTSRLKHRRFWAQRRLNF